MAVMYESAITDAYSDELLKLIRDEGMVQLVDGKTIDLVMLPREKYEVMSSLMELIEAEMVKEGISDIEKGNVVPADETMERLRTKYGL